MSLSNTHVVELDSDLTNSKSSADNQALKKADLAGPALATIYNSKKSFRPTTTPFSLAVKPRKQFFKSSATSKTIYAKNWAS